MAASLTSTDLTLGNTSGASIPGTPLAGQTVLYPKDDKLLYYKDDAGVERSANINLGTAVATTSGTAIDFTGIPAGVKRVSMMLAGVSVNGTSSLLVQIGTSGGIQTSGYVSTYSYTGPSVNGFQTTIGFGSYSDSASAEHHGTFTLSLEEVSNGSWTFIGGTARQTDAHHSISSGGRVLSGTLDRIRLTTINGTDAFDAGSASISWEF